jgi:hypothetical protein
MIHAICVTAADRTLGQLSGILTKAEAHCTARSIPPEVLLTYRLFPDMLNFTWQVTLACDFAARAAARMAGVEPKSFPDTEKTFGELQDRIQAARAYISSFTPDQFDGAPTRIITVKRRGGDTVLPGQDYLLQFSLPQLHFHATTAYDILRHNGVDLGKRDYTGY